MRSITLLLALALLSCTKLENTSDTISPNSQESAISHYLNSIDNSYSIEDHLEMNLLIPKADLLTMDERSYLNKAKQIREKLVPLPEGYTIREDIQLMLFKNHTARPLMQSRKYGHTIYNLVDSLLAKNIFTSEEKQKLEELYAQITPYRTMDEAISRYIDKLDLSGDEIIDHWSMNPELNEFPELANQILHSNIYQLNLSKLAQKYADEIPEFDDFVSIGIFLKNLKEDQLDKSLHFIAFQNILKNESEEHIQIAYRALQKLDLSNKERSLLKLQVDKALADLNTPMPNFSRLGDLPAGSGAALLSKIVENHQGKVIYLNIWSPYCKPCIEEMENGKATKEYYSDKEVAFVYLCGGYCKQKTMEKWVEKLGIEGEHYVLTDQQYHDLSQILRKRGFPIYRLIDKDGRLVKLREPELLRPSFFTHVKSVIDPLLE